MHNKPDWVYGLLLVALWGGTIVAACLFGCWGVVVWFVVIICAESITSMLLRKTKPCGEKKMKAVATLEYQEIIAACLEYLRSHGHNVDAGSGEMLDEDGEQVDEMVFTATLTLPDKRTGICKDRDR